MCVCVPVPLQTLGDADRPNIEKRIESIIKDNQRFQRVVVSRDEALGMFQENKFKVGVGLGGGCGVCGGGGCKAGVGVWENTLIVICVQCPFGQGLCGGSTHQHPAFACSCRHTPELHE